MSDASPTTAPPAARDGLALLAIVALAAWLRWPYLSKGLWWDEYDVVYFASMSADQLLRAFAVLESHPPLYALIGKLALAVFGDGPEAIRLASFAAGMLTVPGLYLLGRLCCGRRVALGAALLLAVSPLHVDFSTNARCLYPLFACLSVWSTAALAMLWTRRDRQHRWALAYGLIVGLSLLTHYYTVLVVATHALFYLSHRGWQRVAPGLLASACLLAATIFYPWFWMSNILPSSNAFGLALTPWVPPLGITTLVEIVEEFVRRGMTPTSAAVVLAVFLCLTFRGARARAHNRDLPWLVLAVAMVPPLILVAISLVLQRSHGSAVLQPRQFIMVAPPVCLLLAMAALGFRNRHAGMMLMVGLIGTSIAGMPTRIPPQGQIVDDLRSRVAPGDVVAVFPMLSFQVLAYHAAGAIGPTTQLIPLVEFGDTPERAVARLETISARANRLWLVERRLDQVGLDERRIETHRRVMNRLEELRTAQQVTVYRGGVPWQLRRYDLATEHAPSSATGSAPTTQVELRFPPSMFSRGLGLMDPSQTSKRAPDDVALAPQRWFGSQETPTPPDASFRRTDALTEVPADGDLRIFVELGPAGTLLSALPLRIYPEQAPPELTIEMGARLLPSGVSALAYHGGRLLLGLALLLEFVTVVRAGRARAGRLGE